MSTKALPANIQALHAKGQITDEEYKLLLLALRIKACRLRSDSVPAGKGYTIRFEIMLNKDVK